MKPSWLREQLNNARQETRLWPDWKRAEIDAEIRKTPKKGHPAQHKQRFCIGCNLPLIRQLHEYPSHFKDRRSCGKPECKLAARRAGAAYARSFRWTNHNL